ncbi:unnamed protein product [Caenorhabditis brenneri]
MESSRDTSFAVPEPLVKKNSETQNKDGETSSTEEARTAPTGSEATENTGRDPKVSLFSSFANALMGTKVMLGSAPFGYGEKANPFGTGSGAPSVSSLFRSASSNSLTSSASGVNSKLFEFSAPSCSTQSGSGAPNSSTQSETPTSSTLAGSEAPSSSDNPGSEATNASSAGPGALKDSTQSKSGEPNTSTSVGPEAPSNSAPSGSGETNKSTRSGTEAPNTTSSTVPVENQENGSKNTDDSGEKDKQPENPPPNSTVAVPQKKGTGNTKTVDCCQQMLNLLHELRRTAKIFRKETHKFTGSSREHKLLIEKLNRRLIAIMNKMTEKCKDLPEEVPKFQEMEMMDIFHEEGPRGLDFQIKMDAIEDKSNWWEGEYHHIHFYTEFMPFYKVARPARIPRSPNVPIPRDPKTPTAQQRHRNFLLLYSAVKATVTPWSFGFVSDVLSFTHNTSFIEFKIVEKSCPKVCIMKILILERLGDIGYITIAAPNQRWDKEANDYGPPKLAPFTAAVHKVYEKFTIDANVKLQERYDMIENLTRERFLWFIWLFAQYRTLFRAKCYGCNKILHNFMPPTTFDKTGKPFHEPCMNRILSVPGMFQGCSS